MSFSLEASSPSVGWLVGRSVGMSIGWSVYRKAFPLSLIARGIPALKGKGKQFRNQLKIMTGEGVYLLSISLFPIDAT